MSEQYFGKAYGFKPPENYERYFVPVIGEPVANDLIRFAALRPGERILDVACGTGIVARLAAQQVGSDGAVAGVDLNSGMLEVARSHAPASISIEWHEASAEAMPLPDESFDVVLCQLGLEFIPDKRAALAEMRRVLITGGRLVLNVPGPTPKFFSVLSEAMNQYISPQAAGFVNQVFALHDTTAVRQLMGEAGFRDITLQVNTKQLTLPPDFLWQYVHSTPLSGMVAQVDDEVLAELERKVAEGWQEFEADGSFRYAQRIVEAKALK